MSSYGFVESPTDLRRVGVLAGTQNLFLRFQSGLGEHRSRVQEIGRQIQTVPAKPTSHVAREKILHDEERLLRHADPKC